MSLPPQWDWEKQEMVLAVIPKGATLEAGPFVFATHVVFGGAGPFDGAPVQLVLFKLIELCEQIVAGIKSATLAATASK